jgi:hypothetical protein
MPKNKLNIDQLGQLIYEIRGQRVMFDSDLASIYGVETKALNRAVKRNLDRFPKDFVFQLTRRESEVLRYQIGTLKTGRGQHRKYLPYAFTEHGAIIGCKRWSLAQPRSCQLPSVHHRLPVRLPLARVLNGARAVQMSVFVVRAFLKMRALLGDKRELAQKLAWLEKELKKRLDVHEAVIMTILQRVMDIIDPPLAPQPPKPRIGFKPDLGPLTSDPPKDGLTRSLPLVSASRLNPSMSLTSLWLHSPCPPMDGLAVARRITNNR